MIETLSEFFSMHGYGWYVWTSYGIVVFALSIQWFIPNRRWKNYLQNKHSNKS